MELWNKLIGKKLENIITKNLHLHKVLRVEQSLTWCSSLHIKHLQLFFLMESWAILLDLFSFFLPSFIEGQTYASLKKSSFTRVDNIARKMTIINMKFSILFKKVSRPMYRKSFFHIKDRIITEIIDNK